MKKICATCGKEVSEDELVRSGRCDDYTENNNIFHPKCLEEEYEYARDKGYI